MNVSVEEQTQTELKELKFRLQDEIYKCWDDFCEGVFVSSSDCIEKHITLSCLKEELEDEVGLIMCDGIYHFMLHQLGIDDVDVKIGKKRKEETTRKN